MEIDKEVILQMSQGDQKAYEQVFRRFYPKVHRFVSMLLKNEDDADDVCQMIFLKVWSKREKFTGIADFDSYLFILAKYTVINYISTKHIIPIDIDSIPTLMLPHLTTMWWLRIPNCSSTWWWRTCRSNGKPSTA